MISLPPATASLIMTDARTFISRLVFESGTTVDSSGIISAQVSFNSPEEDIRPGMVLTSQASITLAADPGLMEGMHFTLYLFASAGEVATWGSLESYTWGDLEGYTWEELEHALGEPIPMGRYKVTSVKLTGSRAALEAHDDLYGADGKYVSGLSFPTTSRNIEQEICNALGIKGIGHSFSTSISAPPEDCTYREMLGFIAALDGGKHAMLDRNGYLIHKDMTDVSYTVSKSRSAEPEAERKALTVTGLHCDKSETTYYQTGSTTRMVTFANPYMTQAIFNTIAAKYVGLSYTPLSAKYLLGDPRLELLDRVTVQGRDKTFGSVPLTGITYSFDGGLSASLTAGGRTDAQTTSSDGPMSRYIKTLVQSAKNATEEELRAAFQDAIDYITGANGGYHIQKFNADGQPTEDYWTDNLDIEKATNILRINQNGILGTNGGLSGTWKTAITNDGRINAAQILTGILTAIVIQSINYSASNHTGSKIDLSDGTFSFAGGRLVWNGTTFSVEGKVTVSDSDSKAVLDDAKLKLYRDNDYLGFIGTQRITDTASSHNGERGIVFDLNDVGDYMSWGSKNSASDTTYSQKFVWYRNGGFYVNDSIKFYGGDFYIHNGNTADIYRDIDMHNWSISNANIVSSSDRRLKDNIRDSSINAADVIRAIKPRSFDWRSDGRHQELGFIADELKAVREGFAADMPDGTQGIKLLETVPYLIKAFQELDERVSKIENDSKS